VLQKSSKRELLQYRLTYLAETEVNWCPGLGTVLANDEIVNGVSERGHRSSQKNDTMEHAYFSLCRTSVARLNDIDWSESIKRVNVIDWEINWGYG
jgi:leucyl-tRNA synthetase